ncbi:MAG: DUF2851 family protein [Verrucomicrobiota bacterium]
MELLTCSSTTIAPRARIYRDWRGQLLGESVREEGGACSPCAVERSELEIQSRWFAGEYGRRFTTTCGRAVTIVQFGHWNQSAGPDFTETVIEVEGGEGDPGREKRMGAVEIDLDVRDWEAHGHGANRSFNAVQLHVYVTGDGPGTFFTRDSDHRQILQVRLDPEATVGGPEESFLQAEARLGRCAAALEEMSPTEIGALLRSAAEYRIEKKTRRLHLLSESHGEQQALYQGLAECLGYRNNRFPFKVLSQKMELKRVRKQSARRTEALFFGLAGFLGGDHHVESVDRVTRSYQRELWDFWWKESHPFDPQDRATELPWVFSGVRPGNHPERRLAALSVLASNWRKIWGLMDKGTFDHREFMALIKSLRHPYWDYHYTLKAAPRKRPMAVIGGSRSLDMLANQILPFLLPERPGLWALYWSLPGSGSNEKLRRAQLRLFGRHPKRETFGRKLYEQQALLQIYRDFCLADVTDCRSCPFPEQLLIWDWDDEPGD